jgi:N-acetylneuraminic acid mutarotase
VERFSLVTLRGEVRPEWEIPKAVRRAGAAAIGKKVYVVGGYDDWTNKYQAALQIFDTTTGAWVRGRNLPQPLDRPTVVSTGGKLYVFGGRSPNNTGLKTAYMYDPATNAWTAKKALPLKRAYAGAAVPFTNKIWLVSGYTESGGTWYFTKDVLEYNVTTNEWEIRDDIPLVGEHSGGGVVNIGSKVICLYGEGDWGAGEWISATSKKWIRNIARADYTGTYTPMLGKLGNTVYVISGSRARNVYKFTSQ